MTLRERILAALAGERPDVVPFTFYEWMTHDTAAVGELGRLGFGITRHAGTYREHTPQVHYHLERFQLEGRRWQRHVIRTPLGEVSKVSKEGWVQQYYIQRPEDYRVVEFMVRDRRYEPSYDTFRALDRELGDRGVVLVNAGRSPLQEILVDFCGVERFCFDIADGRPELLSLYHALVEKQREMYRVIADGPGEVVKLWENLTGETMGPDRFAQFHLPVYREFADMLHARGKRLIAHTDGRLARLKVELAAAPLDGLESITPPPEGDLALDEARQRFGHKSLWINIPVSCYLEPPRKLAAYVRALLTQTQPWNGVLFEISEDLPPNWRESVPVVLAVLEETRQSWARSVALQPGLRAPGG
ncbi:MAG: uroporphyrinogen decarboxylase family protein [Armatimonadota bacterium]|nr:uroporphyrinogen decarboxylase family protein [Armatimonadota bacterium]